MAKTEVAVGDIYPSKRYGDVVVEYINSYRDIGVVFKNTGAAQSVRRQHLLRGAMMDRTVPCKYGVGYIGHGIHKAKIEGKHNPVYSVWCNILRRCYHQLDIMYPYYGERGVRVAEDWHNFQNFAGWYLLNHKQGYDIDKDLRVRDCKIYSEDTCWFIPKRINCAINSNIKVKLDNLPNGVHRNARGKPYYSSLCIDGVKRRLGSFNTADEAFLAYKTAKEDYLKRIATEEYALGTISREIMEALCGWEIRKH